jgi:Mycoplasma protein of unknown function, DUF285
MYTLAFLDTKSLLQKISVNKLWMNRCKKIIDAKCGDNGPKAFQSNQELRDAVEKYCHYNATEMEEIACTYGYPMDKWDVAQIQDMSSLFKKLSSFNEYIGSWDVSKVTSLDVGMYIT